MHERDTEDSRRSIVKAVLLSFLILAIQMMIFFVSAGRIDILRAWAFFGVTIVYFVLSNLVLYRFNPELVAQRLKRKREGSKSWDEVLMRVNNLILILVVPVFAGLDIGRFQWSSLSLHYAVVGFALYIFSSVLINWAMIVNPFFEATVRIQKDRGHTVITTGPYKFVRHPGYSAGILWTLSIPLIMGSLLAFVPAGIYVLSTGIRTSLEDRTLLRELDGYSEYADKVRYRLFPGIW
jgi:protein-S-isoprenylcysteine O-methyltransferase Ste14